MKGKKLSNCLQEQMSSRKYCSNISSMGNQNQWTLDIDGWLPDEGWAPKCSLPAQKNSKTNHDINSASFIITLSHFLEAVLQATKSQAGRMDERISLSQI